MDAADANAELDILRNAYSLALQEILRRGEQITRLSVVNEQLQEGLTQTGDSFEAVRDKLRELTDCESDEFIANAIRSEWGGK